MSGLTEPLIYQIALRQLPLDSKSKLTGYVINSFSPPGRPWQLKLETLVGGTGLSERSVRDALRLLEEAGLLEIVENPGYPRFYIGRLMPEHLAAVDAFMKESRRRRGQLTLEEAQLTAAPPPTPAAPAGDPGSSCRPPRQLLPPLVEQLVEREIEPQLQTPAATAGVDELPYYSPAIEPFRRLAAELADADAKTPFVLANVARDLPEAAVGRALEALRARRQRPGKPLRSEAAYVVATLQELREEHAA